MKKWLREFEPKNHTSQVINITSGEKSIESTSKNPVVLNIDSTEKIGSIVKTTLLKLVSTRLLTSEHLRLLQDEKYCKYTFDINYPFLKKIDTSKSISDQRKINGYDRYWAKVITINQEKYLVCNDWYERNKTKFINWVNGQVN